MNTKVTKCDVEGCASVLVGDGMATEGWTSLYGRVAGKYLYEAIELCPLHMSQVLAGESTILIDVMKASIALDVAAKAKMKARLEDQERQRLAAIVDETAQAEGPLMPVKLGDGRIIRMHQYSSRILRTSLPAVLAPSAPDGREIMWHVIGVAAAPEFDAGGDLVIEMQSGVPVYRASVASLMEARARYYAIDKWGALELARLAIAELGVLPVFDPDALRKFAEALDTATDAVIRHGGDANEMIKGMQNMQLTLELARKAGVPEETIERWVLRDRGEHAWGRYVSTVLGTIALPIMVFPSNPIVLRQRHVLEGGALGASIDGGVQAELYIMERTEVL